MERTGIRDKLVSILLPVWILLLFSSAYARAEQRKLTLMIYICGSNLESMGGSASLDIQEMLDNRPDGDDVSVLLMTGGSNHWDNGFRADQITIHEIGSRGIRTVWPSAGETGSCRNMGDPKTLRFFLEYGAKQYPADDYALILWDHGGGPLTGICWDETQGMDQLSISEVTEALSSCIGITKLAWIGFDACLMGTVEVACALAPYARYMIASQETEPASGWSYSFLKGLAEDGNGAETGRRIIDAYFDTADADAGSLTLSCVDLSRMAALSQSLDTFFAPLAENLSRETFPEFSAVRMNTADFGDSGLRDYESSYDLVDLSSLVSNLDAEKAQTVLQVLEDAVVYNRSGKDGAKGMSIYHPYLNKSNYKSAWQDLYRYIRSSQGYADYLFRFGKLLVGETMTDWSGLQTRFEGPAADGSGDVFTCTLTKEQADHFADARLLILKAHDSNDGISDSYSLVGDFPAQLGEDGVLRAEYSGRALYAVRPGQNENAIGPLSYYRQKDPTISALRSVLLPKNANRTTLENADTGVFFFDCREGLEDADILAVAMHDDVTGTYTQRIAYQPERYSIVYFKETQLAIPANSENGTLPAFSEWPRYKGRIYWKGVDNTRDWGLRFYDRILTGDDLFALFEVTDLQQNSVCSSVIPVRNPAHIPVTVTSGPVETEMYRMELSGNVINSALEQKLKLNFRITNVSDKTIELGLNDLKINNRYLAKGTLEKSLDPGQSFTKSLNVSSDDLIGLSEITRVEITLVMIVQPDEETTKEQLIFTLSDTDVSGIAAPISPLAETEQDGVFCQLLKTSMVSGGDLEMLLRFTNQNERDVKLDLIAVNGIQLPYSVCDDIPAGMERIVTLQVVNDVLLDSITDGIHTSEISGFRKGVLSRDLQQRNGHHQVENIMLSYRYDYDVSRSGIMNLILSEPVEIPDYTPANQNRRWYGPVSVNMPGDLQPLVLLDSDTAAIRTERILAGDNGLAIVLETENRTDGLLKLEITPQAVNGHEEKYYLLGNDWLLPGCIMYHILPVRTDNHFPDLQEVSDLSLKVTGLPNVRVHRIDLSFPSPLRLGVSGGEIIESIDMILDYSAPPVMTESSLIPTEVRYDMYPNYGNDYVILHRDGTAEIVNFGTFSAEWSVAEDNSINIGYAVYDHPLWRIYEENGEIVFLDLGYNWIYKLRPAE